MKTQDFKIVKATKLHRFKWKKALIDCSNLKKLKTRIQI